ncbi:hypothetical protein L7F22_023118 [Adiantum nelumboides]|nr:hypothetical protein [Adiantum nelumboides]
MLLYVDIYQQVWRRTNDPKYLVFLQDRTDAFVTSDDNIFTYNKTGLLHHGYDESRQQAWADPKIGRSPNCWGRAMGSYFMALVDTLDFVPSTHVAKRDDLMAILQRLVEAMAKVQDPPRACAGGRCWNKGDGKAIT